MGEMILARWECGHEVKQVCTEVPGENGIGECPYCRLEAVKDEQTDLREKLFSLCMLADKGNGYISTAIVCYHIGMEDERRKAIGEGEDG